jgi:hypothetical protein
LSLFSPVGPKTSTSGTFKTRKSFGPNQGLKEMCQEVNDP